MSYLEPLVCLVLADLSQEVSTGLTDATCSGQHCLSGLKSHKQKKINQDLESHLNLFYYPGYNSITVNYFTICGFKNWLSGKY